ncbi:signal peptide peptidase SppA [Candidatus Kapabacteria bacterium]|nr:signal peptide peptidase SppA [Candidatus Kapabacteria bacterium]
MSENNGPNIPPPPPQYPPRYKNQRSGGSKWWVPVVIVLGVFVLFIGLVVGGIGYMISQIPDLNLDRADKTVKVESNSVLYIDLASGAPEVGKADPFASLSKKKAPETMFNILNSIERAKEDDNVIGVYLRPKSNLPMSKAMEINDALNDFKKSGKFIYSFIEVGDESTYLSALPADSIFMPTEGMIELNGMSITSMFFKEMTNKIGVDFLTIGWEDFKSAGDMMSKTQFSDSSKHQLRVILDQKYDQFLESVYDMRGISKSESHYIMSKGIYSSQEAIQNKFIDGIASEYDLKRMIRTMHFPKDSIESLTVSTDINLVSIGSYYSSNPKSDREIASSDTQIAIVSASGEISSGYKNSSPFGGDEEGIYSDSFIKNLKKAREDEDVKLIILRIDSPGGSAMASDEMWEEIQLTKKVKPVWASMSSVAASGGYYMSMACDKIYAHPQTITGSIGVILAIPNMSETAEMLGITFDTLATTPAAQFLNGAYKYQSQDIARLKDISWNLYRRFVQRAADSRGLTFDEMRANAKGRVWTGQDALKNGLVDELAGLDKVIDDAKIELGIDPEKLVYLKQYPNTNESLEDFFEKLFNGEENPEAEIKNEKVAEMLGLDPISFATRLSLLPDSHKAQLFHTMKLIELSKKEKILMAMPTIPIFN